MFPLKNLAHKGLTCSCQWSKLEGYKKTGQVPNHNNTQENKTLCIICEMYYISGLWFVIQFPIQIFF